MMNRGEILFDRQAAAMISGAVKCLILFGVSDMRVSLLWTRMESPKLGEQKGRLTHPSDLSCCLTREPHKGESDLPSDNLKDYPKRNQIPKISLRSERIEVQKLVFSCTNSQQYLA